MEAYRLIITSKGQITIPKSIRELLHLLKKDEVILIPTEKEIDEDIKEIRSKWWIDTQ